VAGAPGSPRGASPALPLLLAADDDRSRLLTAIIATVPERGYRDTPVAEIVARAGLSEANFFRCFADKEDCFLAAYDLAVAWLGGAIARALERSGGWPQGVRVAVSAALDCLATEPRLARFCGIEVLFAGPVALGRHQAAVERLAVPLRAGRVECAWDLKLPNDIEQIAIGGAIWLLAHKAGLDGSESLTALAPDLTYFLLVPYVGIEDAQRLAAGGAPTRGPAASGG
jgi:AcrR family transcriptional regulator